MNNLIVEVQKFVENNIGKFHHKRLENLKSLKLLTLLKKKNPYLFKAKNVNTSELFIKSILDAHLSSQEEAMFGDFLEEIAILVNSIVYNGQKSAAEGIDLEFVKDNIRYIVSVKSGPNWGNSQQIRRMRSNFNTAKKILRTSNSDLIIKAINGCCYGKDNKPDKGDYEKLCGQRFWELISGDSNLYTKIIEPLGHKAKEKNDEFNSEYAKLINAFSLIFGYNFCNPDGSISWIKILELNSSKEKSIKKLEIPPLLKK